MRCSRERSNVENIYNKKKVKEENNFYRNTILSNFVEKKIEEKNEISRKTR